MKRIIKKILPDIILSFLVQFRYGWRGNFSSWDMALKSSSGYDAENILEKVKDSSLKVRDGLVPYERDSVIFKDVQYSFQLLAGLMWVSAINHGQLHVLDYGGSLGSSYYQNKTFLDQIPDVKWCIVEQPGFVKEGQENFSNRRLVFFDTIDDCLRSNKINVVLLSSVLQYLEKPYNMLKDIISRKIDVVIIDRTPFVRGEDRITVQKVNPKIYRAKYPCWFFNIDRFLGFMEPEYDMILSFDALDKANILSEFKGFIFKKKKH